MKLSLTIVALFIAKATPFYHEDIGIPEAARIKKAEENGLHPSRVAGGFYAYLGAYPFFAGLIVAIDVNTTSVCGSSLISETKLLTAAHCWYDGQRQAVLLEVVLGSILLFAGGTRIITNEVEVHSDFNIQNILNDIAVITVPAVQLDDYIQPIPLPGAHESFVNFTCHVIGFGRTGDNTPVSISQQLSHTSLIVIGNEECARAYGPIITDSSICTVGTSTYNGPCGGDSGGPIFYNNDELYVQIGIVSFGSSDGCEAGHPTSHTRITSFLDWIQERL